MSRDVFCRYHITTNYTVKYWTYDGLHAPAAKQPDRNISQGYLSPKAMSRLKERVNYMVYIAKRKSLRKSIHLPVTNYKLIFITLTLSSAQIHSDKEIKRALLQPFIRMMRSKWKVVNYIWKAEAQSNGNIHFHITIDKYIAWQEVRLVWNTLQESLGYVTRSSIEDPNSTDIHAVYKKENPAAYMCKELSKKDFYKSEGEHTKWSEHYYKELLEITACDVKSKKEVGIKRAVEGKLYDCNIELKSINARYHEEYAINDDLANIAQDPKKHINKDFVEIYLHDHPGKGVPALQLILDHFIREAYVKGRKGELKLNR